MEELFETSIIKALIFSTYHKFGPSPIYMFPQDINEDEYDALDDNDKLFKFTHRDYVQISIKNLSLLIGDLAFTEDAEILRLKNFGILPYPDYRVTALTYFHFIKYQGKNVATAFSVLVDERRRSFLYNNIDRIKPIIIEFFENFDKEITEDYRTSAEVESHFQELLLKLQEIEKRPATPITSQRKMKILLAGLDDSGKTSFLLCINRRFSKLINLSPTVGAKVKSIEALGATVFLWDLGGQKKYRDKYLSKSQIYLYEADLVFFFIDITNKERFDESLDYLEKIISILNRFDQNTSIVFILSKADPDIVDRKETKENFTIIKSKLAEILKNQERETYYTSIFSIFSVLRAFSSGISKLSVNKDLINQNLKIFSSEIGLFLTLILSKDGLVLADYYSKEAFSLTELPKNEEIPTEHIRDIFEITAPQFAVLFKIFSKFKTLQKDEAVFKVASSIILFKKIDISEHEMFFLFLMEDESKREKIYEKLPDFVNRTKDLLLRYIA